MLTRLRRATTPGLEKPCLFGVGLVGWVDFAGIKRKPPFPKPCSPPPRSPFPSRIFSIRCGFPLAAPHLPQMASSPHPVQPRFPLAIYSKLVNPHLPPNLILLLTGQCPPRHPCSVCAQAVTKKKKRYSYLCSGCLLWVHDTCSLLPNHRAYFPTWLALNATTLTSPCTPLLHHLIIPLLIPPYTSQTPQPNNPLYPIPPLLLTPPCNHTSPLVTYRHLHYPILHHPPPLSLTTSISPESSFPHEPVITPHSHFTSSIHSIPPLLTNCLPRTINPPPAQPTPLSLLSHSTTPSHYTTPSSSLHSSGFSQSPTPSHYTTPSSFHTSRFSHSSTTLLSPTLPPPSPLSPLSLLSLHIPSPAQFSTSSIQEEPSSLGSFLQLNTNGILNSFDQILHPLHPLQEHKIKIACIQETKLKHNSSLPDFPNHSAVRRDRPSGGGGGLLILVHHYPIYSSLIRTLVSA